MTTPLFGTDGIRARAGEGPLALDNVYRIGLAIGRLLKQKGSIFSTRSDTERPTGPVLIGRDTRASGAAIEAQLTNGIMAFGNEVWSAGILPTPGIAHLTRTWTCSLGMVVSASHNPAEDNGIKLFSPEGFKIPDRTEQEIENLFSDPMLAAPDMPSTAAYQHVENRTEEYLRFLRHQLGGRLHGIKIVVDCAHGATTPFAAPLFQSLGAAVIAVNASPDGKNINQDAAVLNPTLLIDRVRNEKANLGACYDGDGDRCILIDETRVVRDGDAILAACALALPRGSTIVSTVMANYGLESWLRGHGYSLRRTPVGDRWVAEEMVRTGALLGGEQSGHIIFRDASPAGDGLLTTLRVLHLMQRQGQTLSELCRGFSKAPQLLINIPVRSKPPLDSVEPITQAIREAERGFRGRILVRYSGTEPLCRVMVEGADTAEVRHQAESLASVVRQHLG